MIYPPESMNVDTKNHNFRFRMRGAFWGRTFPTHNMNKVSFGFGGLLFMVFLPLLFGCGEKGPSQDIQAVESKLWSLEKRITQIEVKERKVDQLESRIKGLQNKLSNLENSERSLSGQLNKLDQRIDLLTKETTQAPVKAETAAPVVAPSKKEPPPPKTEKGLHIVRSGDTLYRIAMKYGISVAELRRLNKLSEKQFIFPGQKLRVSPEAQ